MRTKGQRRETLEIDIARHRLTIKVIGYPIALSAIAALTFLLAFYIYAVL
jgi:hypothetical protein